MHTQVKVPTSVASGNAPAMFGVVMTVPATDLRNGVGDGDHPASADVDVDVDGRNVSGGLKRLRDCQLGGSRQRQPFGSLGRLITG